MHGSSDRMTFTLNLPFLQTNWPSACPVLVIQLVVLNFINNSYRHILVINTVVNARFGRASIVIHMHP